MNGKQTTNLSFFGGLGAEEWSDWTRRRSDWIGENRETERESL